MKRHSVNITKGHLKIDTILSYKRKSQFAKKRRSSVIHTKPKYGSTLKSKSHSKNCSKSKSKSNTKSKCDKSMQTNRTDPELRTK